MSILWPARMSIEPRQHGFRLFPAVAKWHGLPYGTRPDCWLSTYLDYITRSAAQHHTSKLKELRQHACFCWCGWTLFLFLSILCFFSGNLEPTILRPIMNKRHNSDQHFHLDPDFHGLRHVIYLIDLPIIYPNKSSYCMLMLNFSWQNICRKSGWMRILLIITIAH